LPTAYSAGGSLRHCQKLEIGTRGGLRPFVVELLLSVRGCEAASAVYIPKIDFRYSSTGMTLPQDDTHRLHGEAYPMTGML